MAQILLNHSFRLTDFKIRPARCVFQKTERQGITAAEVADMIVDFCKENDLEYPRYIRRDLKILLEDLGPLNHVSHIKNKLCRAVNKAFADDPRLKAKYAELKRDVQAPIRIQLANLLGFEEYITQVREDVGMSDRALLIEFFENLPEGKTWEMADIKSIEKNGKPAGKRLYNRILGKIGFSVDIVRVILGEGAEELLSKNPPTLEVKINTLLEARHYLIEFLEDFTSKNPVDTPWRYADLRLWKAADGSSGELLQDWIYRNTPGEDYSQEGVEEFIRHILASQADNWLTKHPFALKENTPTDTHRMNGYFLEFLNHIHENLEEGKPWELGMLKRWKSSDGTGGSWIVRWIYKTIRIGDTIDRWFILEHMIPDEYKGRNPFYYNGQPVAEQEDLAELEMEKSIYTIENLQAKNHQSVWMRVEGCEPVECRVVIQEGVLNLIPLTDEPSEVIQIGNDDQVTSLGLFAIENPRFEWRRQLHTPTNGKINPGDIYHLIVDFCEENEIEIPEGFEGDFKAYLGNLHELKAFKNIRKRLCAAINKALADPLLAEKYSSFRKILQRKINLILLQILGLDEYITKTREDNGMSDQDLLIAFFQQLPEEYEWEMRDIKKFKIEGKNLGSRFFDRWDHFMTPTGEVVRYILGDQADEIMQKNPPKVAENITIVDAREYLIEFLEGFALENSHGTPWRYAYLKDWVSRNGFKGATLRDWMFRNNPNYDSSEQSAKEFICHILGSRSEKWMSRHPFELVEKTTRDIFMIKKYLIEFLEYANENLKRGEPVSLGQLRNWNSKDGTSGLAIFKWINGNLHINGRGGMVDMAFIYELIAAHLKRRNPFYYDKKKWNQNDWEWERLHGRLKPSSQKVSTYSELKDLKEKDETLLVVVTPENKDRLSGLRFRPRTEPRFPGDTKRPLKIGEIIECKIKPRNGTSLQIISQANSSAEPIVVVPNDPFVLDQIQQLNLHRSTLEVQRDGWRKELAEMEAAEKEVFDAHEAAEQEPLAA